MVEAKTKAATQELAEAIGNLSEYCGREIKSFAMLWQATAKNARVLLWQNRQVERLSPLSILT